MKRVRVEKRNRNFGIQAAWYMHENVAEVAAENPRYYCGGKMFPAAYFVLVEEHVYDPMRDFNPSYWVEAKKFGPFANEAKAEEFAAGLR